MVKKYLALALIALTVGLFSTFSTFAQIASNSPVMRLDAKAQEMKEKIQKISVGGDITIIDKKEREFYGVVLRIEDERAVIREVDLKKTIEINYADMKKVLKDYGASRSWDGRRIRPKKHFIGLVVGAAAILVPVALVVASRD